ncbi:MAG: hypothetical protein IPJ18_05225 [Betaproteobacteria bacterium]|nr:hypothetical protein [Betaproteobacteria bacterium]
MTTNHASGHQCETYSEAIFIEDSQSITQVGSTLICIGNDGAKVADTNYFDTGFARLGLMFLSVNANAVRLLIPDSQWHLSTR